LEVSEEADRKDSALAQKAARLQLQDPPHLWKDKHTSRHAIVTQWARHPGVDQEGVVDTPRSILANLWTQLGWLPRITNSGRSATTLGSNGRMGEEPAYPRAGWGHVERCPR